VDLGLTGKVGIVTGGSEGIGRATAQSLGREGASVVICARRADVLHKAAQDVAEATGAEIIAVPADVTNAQDIERLVQTTVDRFGRLDFLVNNAGTSAAGAFESVTDQAWQADLDLKVFGAIRATRAALPHLRKAGQATGAAFGAHIRFACCRDGADEGALEGARGRQHPRQRHQHRPDQKRTARPSLA
jgi:NAD(P)-dependent dehydrogenase (short-subunit alcohol dehydrogenase family)